jgi:L-cysteine S-thiosulfotransferase
MAKDDGHKIATTDNSDKWSCRQTVVPSARCRRFSVNFRRTQITTLLLIVMLTTGCAYNSSFGFPVERGRINEGRQAFIDHQCHQCHSVAGVRFPELAGASLPILELGGESSVVQSFAGLVTSIINPNHVISDRYREQLGLNAAVPLESPMPIPHIDTMTVRQLIDLVTFLDSRYELIATYDSMTEI